MGKLKEIRDALTGMTASIEQRTNDAADRLRQVQEGLAESDSTFRRLLEEGEAALEGLGKAKAEWEGEVFELLDTTQKKITAQQQAAKEQQAHWVTQQEQSFEAFRERQLADLDRVSKAYERMRVSYDSMKVTTESLEAELESTSKNNAAAIEKLSTETRNLVQEVREEIGERAAAVLKAARTEMLERRKQMAEKVVEALKAQSQKTEEAAGALERLTKRYKHHRVVDSAIWVGFGIALLILLLLALAK